MKTMRWGWAQKRKNGTWKGPWDTRSWCDNPDQAFRIQVKMVECGTPRPKGWTKLPGPWYAAGKNGPWYGDAYGRRGGKAHRVVVYGRKP